MTGGTSLVVRYLIIPAITRSLTSHNNVSKPNTTIEPIQESLMSPDDVDMLILIIKGVLF